ncbi:hypothetical protein H4R21_003146 [Coemansia helicoidea]|uniref:Uncharacterized protein n=2 Tax=Coemansia TaxID=4863 RepID=A0ACC1L344_9FUNG|nr:hypothetical protein H4R21_003146 [Coemansia helicoidea]
MASPVQTSLIPSGEEGRSSSETPTRAKRAQVKNACVNCQKACKKCDAGRPCQRCVKYSLVDSCVDSKRKPRKKGIKRGPYKKRKRNPTDDDAAAAAAGGVAGWSGPDPSEPAAALPIGRTTARPLPSASHAGSPRGSDSLRRARQSRTMGQRVQRQPPPPVLGPGAIPILHVDPAPDDSDYSEDSSSDVPLLAQHASGALSAVSYAAQQYRPAAQPPQPQLQPGMYGIPPETPTAGLATAFRSLATTRPRAPPSTSYHHPHHGHSQHPHHRPPAFSQTATAPIRLPPIASFDHAQALGSPPNTSSLAILTDVALGRGAGRPTAPALYPPLPRPPGHFGHRHHYSDPENSGQQSHDPPPPEGRPRPQYARSAGASEASSLDSCHSADGVSRAFIRRLSRRLHDTHIEQEHAGL